MSNYIAYINCITDNRLINTELETNVLNERKQILREDGNRILTGTDGNTGISFVNMLQREDLVKRFLERLEAETIINISDEIKQELINISEKANVLGADSSNYKLTDIPNKVFDLFEEEIGVSQQQIKNRDNEENRKRKEDLKRKFLKGKVSSFENKTDYENYDGTEEIYLDGRKLSDEEIAVLREVAILRRDDAMYTYDIDCISKKFSIVPNDDNAFSPIENDSAHAKIDEFDQIVSDFIFEKDGETIAQLVERFNRYSELFTKYYLGGKVKFNGYGDILPANLAEVQKPKENSNELTGQRIGVAVIDEIKNTDLRIKNEKKLNNKEKNMDSKEEKESEEYGSL